MYKVSFTAQICIFAAALIIGLIAVSACNSIISTLDISERTSVLIVSSLQGIIAFCLPSFIVAACGKYGVIKTLTLDKTPQIKSIVGVLIAFVIGFAMLNQVVYWNDSLTLPQSMYELESSLRSVEENARRISGLLLDETSIGALIINVLVIGILTGFSEEIFFRAGLQRLLGQVMSKHFAIWLSAYIFSTMHFQFYGFVPRLLMGAFFGYVYFWTGNIWVSAFAHAFNNSIVVITTWLINSHIASVNVEELGVTHHGFPIYASISLLLLVLFFRNRSVWFNKRQI